MRTADFQKDTDLSWSNENQRLSENPRFLDILLSSLGHSLGSQKPGLLAWGKVAADLTRESLLP
ncbi:MAG: hypothetical protein DCC55_26690 [Chloroflexi bacterium]|nr:MAG: hypothetical protein DCC55_26690 [Chloroflexota bacterium]